MEGEDKRSAGAVGAGNDQNSASFRRHIDGSISVCEDDKYLLLSTLRRVGADRWEVDVFVRPV